MKYLSNISPIIETKEEGLDIAVEESENDIGIEDLMDKEAALKVSDMI